ncbi:glycosyltransferase [Iodobacter sp. CM08]|uniref:glycosyltransferase n=1 Tax=Iodobacter sp. CM08 TaxID=3085902 RepID=UPI00298158F0|nr:glycosyltransferase [Iodobacter sp. CM08]MDW5416969.1 glycosyltransferase [Iodobacter sp. CM08]
MDKPLVSVLMCLNKIDEYTSDAIESIINQTMKEIEIILVVNGDGVEENYNFLLEKYKAEQRIKLISVPIGQLAFSLNVALSHTKADLIARMDTDDVSYLDRLQKQYDYLKNKDLDFVGCDINLINEFGHNIGKRVLPKGRDINKKLPFLNPFVHGSVMAKRSLFIAARGYNSGFNSEDYDLWLRLHRKGIKWDNMPDILLAYRIHSAATQRRLLGYAEATGLSVREFILNKNIINFFAILFHFYKSVFRSRK